MPWQKGAFLSTCSCIAPNLSHKIGGRENKWYLTLMLKGALAPKVVNIFYNEQLWHKAICRGNGGSVLATSCSFKVNQSDQGAARGTVITSEKQNPCIWDHGPTSGFPTVSMLGVMSFVLTKSASSTEQRTWIPNSALILLSETQTLFLKETEHYYELGGFISPQQCSSSQVLLPGTKCRQGIAGKSRDGMPVFPSENRHCSSWYYQNGDFKRCYNLMIPILRNHFPVLSYFLTEAGLSVVSSSVSEKFPQPIPCCSKVSRSTTESACIHGIDKY